jgi:cytochrome oxidase Cu insertion factor (SCO1/SenC/PrrC family)
MPKNNSIWMWFLFLTMTVIVSGCGGAAPATVNEPEAVVEEAMPAQDEAMADKDEMADEAMAEDEAMADEAMDKADEAMMDEDEAMDKTDEAMADEAMMDKDEAMAEDEAMDDEAMAGKDEMSDEAMAEDEAMTDKEAMDDEAMADDEAMEVPAWFTTQLTDVNTGEAFSVADFQGKVVLVETMAVWCPFCTQQQQHIQALAELLGERDDFVRLSLDIDPNEAPDILKAHTERQGFDWRFAVAPPDMARDIGQLYGAQFLNPPATPVFIIDRHGEVHALPFGQKDSAALQAAITPFLDEG